MDTEDFKKKLHSILNEDYDMRKFDLQEESEHKQDFIFTDPTGKVYNIQVEADENEFYVYDQNGKKLDIFQLDMLDLDGGVTKDIRKEIVDHYRKNVSKEEVVAEMIAPNVKNIQPEFKPEVPVDTVKIKKPVVAEAAVKNVQPEFKPEEPQTVKITKPVVVVKESVMEKLKPFTVVPKTKNVLEDIPIQFNTIIDGQKHEVYSSAADVYFDFSKGDSGSMGSHDKRTGGLVDPGSPSYPDEYEIIAISVGQNPKDDGYIVNLENNSDAEIEFAKLPTQFDVAPLMDDAAHTEVEKYLDSYRDQDMNEAANIKNRVRNQHTKKTLEPVVKLEETKKD